MTRCWLALACALAACHGRHSETDTHSDTDAACDGPDFAMFYEQYNPMYCDWLMLGPCDAGFPDRDTCINFFAQLTQGVDPACFNCELAEACIADLGALQSCEPEYANEPQSCKGLLDEPGECGG